MPSHYTITCKGSIQKTQQCAACGTEYAFALTETAVGSATGMGLFCVLDPRWWRLGCSYEKLAEKRADRNLKKKLARGTDASRCPACDCINNPELVIERVKDKKFSKKFDKAIWLTGLFGGLGIILLVITILSGKELLFIMLPLTLAVGLPGVWASAYLVSVIRLRRADEPSLDDIDDEEYGIEPGWLEQQNA